MASRDLKELIQVFENELILHCEFTKNDPITKDTTKSAEILRDGCKVLKIAIQSYLIKPEDLREKGYEEYLYVRDGSIIKGL